ncbi:MAG: ArnT family glycosyltransferase [Chloroflexota bacterium]
MDIQLWRRRWTPLLVGALTVYLALVLIRLDRVPVINPDEAAYTEPAWTLLTQGRFAAPMYTGMLRIDERWYFLWPGYALLAAIPYAVLGVDVVATRVVSASFGVGLLLAVWWLAVLATTEDQPGEPSEVPRRAGPTLALGLALVHPTIFALSRLGRPEIAVTACAVFSTALASRGDRRGAAVWWHAAAGAAAALSFLMHQYGSFALAALAVCYLLQGGGLRRAVRPALLASVGASLVLLPWLVWVAADWVEFRTQLGAQLEYQRWRYTDAGEWRNAVRELPGRYVLGRQDYPAGWQAWREAAEYVVGPRALSAWAGHAESPRAFLPAYVAHYWLRAGPAAPMRLVATAVFAVGITAGLRALAARGVTGRRGVRWLRWVWLPMVVWALALALIPNKWDGYTGAVSAYACVLVGVTAIHRVSRAAVAGVMLASAAGIGYQLAHPPPAYAGYVSELRTLVPPGARVASAMREWFAFAGRNPAMTYEFRTVPVFTTSVVEMIRGQRPEYLALRVADDAAAANGQRYFFIYRPWDELYQYLDHSTERVGTVSDPWLGTVEVRRVLTWPP